MSNIFTSRESQGLGGPCHMQIRGSERILNKIDTMNNYRKTRLEQTIRRIMLSVSASLLILSGLSACGGDSPDAASTDVNQAMLADLSQRVPELGEEPLPEPRPRDDANPANIPERLRKALTQEVLETITGDATFYADKFEGRRTASGIPFRQNQMVAAHRAYPFGTILRVTNLRNDRSVNVRVVDRGPFGATSKARRPVIDLSRRAATQLDLIDAGVGRVRIEVLQWGKGIDA